MNGFRWIIILICAAGIGLSARAEATYEQLQVKADRLFDQDDWIPAGALYNYMIHERPKVSDNYGRAVVAAYAASDTVAPLQYLSLALQAHVPFDSVLTKVRTYAFEKSRASVYERFMLRASKMYPWLARPLEPYLLQYYASRRNAPQMIHYAQALLQGLPGNPEFLSVLAQGYMLDNQYDKAVQTWMEIINTHPDNFTALVDLATFYNQSSRPAEALPYFRRAEAVRPTPYIRQQIKSITQKLENGKNQKK